MDKKSDYLVVGSGLFGAVFAHEANARGKKVLVIDKRNNIAGNVYTEKIEGINVHIYGAHIFHTNLKHVWEYVTKFAEFNRFTNSPVANYHGELFSLPFNMYTFNKMWGVVTPEEAAAKIEEQKREARITEPKNLEEQAISLVGTDIYEKLIKGYTEKQWGRPCTELPAFIIKRLPVRLTFDNNYFNALYQGIPVGGYTKMVANMLEGIEVRVGVDYLANKAELDALADKVVYTGAIDAYFGYKLGNLEYRSVRFENEILDKPNFQGNAAVNYTDRETPWTRIIEHKWFEYGKDENGNDLPKTVISREYSSEWKPGDEPYYPVNDEKNSKLYAEYKKLADAEDKVIFGGRLGEYKYYDMDAVIDSALKLVEREPKGLGHAILCAKRFVGHEPFAVLLGDDVVYNDEYPCLKQLIDVYNATGGSVLGCQTVPQDKVSAYGIVASVLTDNDRVFKVKDMVEKPAVVEAPSRLAVLGRYVITPEIFRILDHTAPGKGGEIQLTDALKVLARQQDMYAYDFIGRRYDVGDKQGYLEAQVEYALRRDDLAGKFREYLKSLVVANR